MYSFKTNPVSNIHCTEVKCIRVSKNHLQIYCCFNSLFRLTIKKASKLRITGHFSGEMTIQLISSMYYISMSWSHHVMLWLKQNSLRYPLWLAGLHIPKSNVSLWFTSTVNMLELSIHISPRIQSEDAILSISHKHHINHIIVSSLSIAKHIIARILPG